jgi:isopenicillin N synthase-like dioxygenase
VPGLEVYDFAATSWLEIDTTLRPTDLVLFCAESLQRFSNSGYKGTVHRVGKDAQHRPRLSMVYKMRHRALLVKF